MSTAWSGYGDFGSTSCSGCGGTCCGCGITGVTSTSEDRSLEAGTVMLTEMYDTVLVELIWLASMLPAVSVKFSESNKLA